MKKILFASTALIASAGIAAADVSVGGDGRMGVIYDSSEPDNKFSFTSRIRISFRATGTTDSGLTFGGSIRADNADPGASGNAGNVFISGEFGRITMGDIDGAAETVVGDLQFRSLHGVTGIGNHHRMDYLTNDMEGETPVARYDYSIDAFTFSASAGNPGEGDDIYSVGLGYDAGMFGVAIGHERFSPAIGDSVNHTIAGVTASVDGVADFKAIYGRGSGGFKQYGVSAQSSFDAFTITAYVRRTDADGDNRMDYAGIGGSYALGGGAELRAGIVRVKEENVGSHNLADFGIRMSF